MENTELNFKINGIKQAVEDTKSLNKELKETQEKSGLADKTGIEKMREYRKELNNIRGNLTELKLAGKEGGEEFVKLQERAAALTDTIGDVNSEIKALASDTHNLDLGIGAFKAGISAVGIYSSAISALRGEEEDSIETIKNLQKAQTVLNSLQEIDAQLKDRSTFLSKAYSKAIELTTSATNKFGKALTATGIGLFIVALGTVVANFDKIKEKLLELFPGLQEFGKYFENITGVLKGVGKTIVNTLITPLKEFSKVVSDIMSGNFKQAFKDFGGAFKSAGEEFLKMGENINKEVAKQTEERLKNEKIAELENEIAIAEAKGKTILETYKKKKELLKLEKEEGIKTEKEYRIALTKLETDYNKELQRLSEERIKIAKEEQERIQKDIENTNKENVKADEDILHEKQQAHKLGDEKETEDLGKELKKRAEARIKATKEANEKELEEDRKKAQEKKDQIRIIAESTLSTFGDIYSMAIDAINSSIDSEIDEVSKNIEKIDKALDNTKNNISKYEEKLNDYQRQLSEGTIEEQQRAQTMISDTEAALSEQRALEKKQQKEKEAEEKKQRKLEAQQKRNDLKNQLVQSIINTAMSVSQALASTPPPASYVLAALSGTMGAAETAIISTQMSKIKYANGGLLNGPSHSEGGMRVGNSNIEVEGGEFVVNKRATMKYLPLLENINSYGVKKYADGGILTGNSSDLNNQLRFIDNLSEIKPVVSVVDINKGINRLNNVKTMVY